MCVYKGKKSRKSSWEKIPIRLFWSLTLTKFSPSSAAEFLLGHEEFFDNSLPSRHLH